jgi:predicted site-specific integrase-resolvase
MPVTRKFQPGGHFRKTFGISTQTLRNWSQQNKIRYATSVGGKRFYDVLDVEGVLFKGRGTTSSNEEEKETILYARVSSSKQKGDLTRQIEFLRGRFPSGRVISDVASGINWKRKGLKSLLERVCEGNVERVVVTYKDRLACFATELLEWFFKKFDVELLVLNGVQGSDDAHELSDDLLAIVTVFTSRHHGRRSKKQRIRANGIIHEMQSSSDIPQPEG